MDHARSGPTACRFLAVLSVLLGGAGMTLSFVFLASASFADVTAGASGFVAGAVLVGSGLLTLALLARPAARAG
jgi:hypothetical protein